MITKFWLYTTIALLALASCVISLTSELVYDDERAARELHGITSLTDLRGLASQMAPVRQITLAVDAATWKKDNLGFHSMNLVYHALTALVLLALLRQLLGCAPAAQWTAGLFALIPISAAAVGVVAHRGEILGTLMMLIACLAWLRPQRDWIAWTVGGIAAALAAVETSMSLMLPLLLLAYDQLLVAPSSPERTRSRWVETGAVALALFALHIAHRWWVSVHSYWSPESWETAPAWSDWLIRSLRDWPAGVFVALRWLVFPLPFINDHGLTPSSWFVTLAGLATLAVLAALIRSQMRQQPRLAFGLAWLLAGCAVAALNVFRYRYGAIHESELYTIAPGLCLLGGIAIERFCKLERISAQLWVEVGALTIMAITLGTWSNWRAYQFRSETRLLAVSLSNHPDSGLSHLALGRLCLETMRRTADKGVMRVTAEREFEKARELNWNYYETYGNLGEMAMHRRDYTRAESCYRQALALHPTGTGGRLRLGNALHAQRRFSDAREIYQQLLIEKPRAIDLYRLIADTYEAENKITEATRFLEQAKRLMDEARQKELEAAGNKAEIAAEAPPVVTLPVAIAPQTNAPRSRK
ncbi:MAG: tetratricopeptide repeat protein [Verrucomicrobia bacterium]|nr:tetratricopeptide repeat protein [Verrucomicrobiota bacterium]